MHLLLLEATNRLAQLLASPKRRSRLEDALISVIARHGGPEDARALLEELLRSPSQCAGVLPILIAHGDRDMAAALADRCVRDGRLIEDAPADVLHALGALGLAEATPLLFWYLRHGTYWESMPASIGLLHLPCTEIQAEIAQEIAACEGRNIFPEFIPALAYKTGDASWIDRLVAMGSGPTSTDCNGGLLLGIALFGETARERFAEVLRDPHWEACGGSTGSCRWAYVGTRLLGLTPQVLYADLCKRLSGPVDLLAARHQVCLLVEMVRAWACGASTGLRWLPAAPTSATELLELLFAWSDPNRDDGLSGRVREALGNDAALHMLIYGLNQELTLRMNHEIERDWALTRK